MSEEIFTKTLRAYTQRKPFLPFIVQLVDGRRIVVEHPGVAFGGGVAGFVSDSEGLVGFSCDEVSSIDPVPAEAAS
jgi:hypothetical protein